MGTLRGAGGFSWVCLLLWVGKISGGKVPLKTVPFSFRWGGLIAPLAVLMLSGPAHIPMLTSVPW